MSGAKNCPETPRQKMIGMMYLVLTAMLALNVSAAILNGYTAVDDSLHATIETTISSNNVTYERFAAALAQNPEKTQEWYDKAQEVKKASDEMYQYIQNFKNEMIRLSDGSDAVQDTVKVRDMKKQDDTNVPHNYGINEGHGAELKAKINEFAAFLEAECENNANLKHDIDLTFATKEGRNADGKPITWEESLFHEMPICATITVLSKLQNDVRNYEGKVVSYLLSATDAGDVRVNKMGAYIIPSSEYVIRGSKYRAQIILAGVDSTKTPEYYINGQKINEQGIYEITASGTGEQHYKGQIAYQHLGETVYLPFEGKYTVGEPTATLSHLDLNVLFKKYDNPFSVSVPGVSNEKIQIRCQGASITKKNGQWIIRLPEKCPDIMNIEVMAEMDGKTVSMGSMPYRVKPMPDPGVYFEKDGAIVEGEKIARSALINPKNRIVASYGKEGLLPAKFTVSSFRVQFPNGDEPDNKGDRFEPKILKSLERVKAGNTIIIKYIYAKYPDGSEKRIPGNIVLKLD